jgi:hypothetical protein
MAQKDAFAYRATAETMASPLVDPPVEGERAEKFRKLNMQNERLRQNGRTLLRTSMPSGATRQAVSPPSAQMERVLLQKTPFHSTFPMFVPSLSW